MHFRTETDPTTRTIFFEISQEKSIRLGTDGKNISIGYVINEDAGDDDDNGGTIPFQLQLFIENLPIEVNPHNLELTVYMYESATEKYPVLKVKLAVSSDSRQLIFMDMFSYDKFRKIVSDYHNIELPEGCRILAKLTEP